MDAEKLTIIEIALAIAQASRQIDRQGFAAIAWRWVNGSQPLDLLGSHAGFLGQLPGGTSQRILSRLKLTGR